MQNLDRRLVEELYGQGLLLRSQRNEVLKNMDRPLPRLTILSRWILVVGVGLLLSGAIFFFAFNWHQIPHLLKLYTVQGALVIALVVSYGYGFDRPAGHLSLVTASALTGLFLAVFGQVYQTGADSYHLFFAWAALTFVWTAVSTTTATWILWLGVVNVAIILYTDETYLFPDDHLAANAFLMATVNGTYLLLKEFFFCQRGILWLGGRPSRLVLVIGVLLPLFLSVSNLIFGFHPSGFGYAGLLLSIVAHSLLYWYFAHREPDTWPLVVVALSVGCLVELLLIKLFDESGARDIQPLLIGLSSLANFTIIAVFLKRTIKKMAFKHDAS